MSIILDGTSGITSPNETVTGQFSSGSTFGFKNRIINGGMVIDQRNAGAAVTPTTNSYTIDRWLYVQSLASKFTIRQNLNAVTPPTGFSNHLGVSTASAVTVGTSDTYALRQAIEGFNIADLAWGTANASPVALSFLVRSSLTGTFGGSATNGAENRSYPFTFSIPSANTWTSISITIAGDTTGTWTVNNTSGLELNFGLGVGSTYSGTAGTWAGTNYLSATGATSVVGTSGATFYITGVQLEKGSVATSFDQRAYSQELAMCQRYYYNSGSTRASQWQGYAVNSQGMFISVNYPVKPRTTPTIALTNSATTGGALSVVATGTDAFVWGGLGGTTGNNYIYTDYTLSAEL